MKNKEILEVRRALLRMALPRRRKVSVAKVRPWALRAAQKKAYRKANADRIRIYKKAQRVKNADKIRAYLTLWRKANPKAGVAYKARCRARRLAAPGVGVTARDWRLVLDESLGICAYCNERTDLTMDHIEPLARGGLHDPSNIAGACIHCNSSKSDIPLVLWLARNAA